MSKFFRKLIAGIGLFLLADSVFSQPAQVLVVPECLLSKKFQYELLGEQKELRLIKTTQFKEFSAMRIKQPIYCSGFINVTTAWRRKNKDAASFLRKYLPEMRPSDFTRSYKIQHAVKVKELFHKIDTKDLAAKLNFLADLPDRYVNSNSGVYAAEWLKLQLKAIVKTYERDDADIFSIATINHGRQPSIVLRIGKDLQTPAIVIGAHIDTMDSTHEYQPGADSNASGVVTTMEAARVLLASDIKFEKPIYFIWYAGEEAGKLGSQSVIEYFNRNNIPIDSVLQLDETGYVDKELGIGLTDDYTDAGLTAFIADLAVTYLKLPVAAVRCGYACSDHMMWYLNGNRVVYPFTTMNDEGSPYAHTRKDTVDTVSLDHVVDFVRLTLAFAVELGL